MLDGDYDILVSKVLDASIGNEKFKDKIIKSSSNGSSALTAALKNERLNIAIPLLIEKWDIEKSSPLVAVDPLVDESEVQFLIAFDENGTKYIIDANKDPDVPVIIVGLNERNLIGKTKNGRSPNFRARETSAICSYSPFRANERYEMAHKIWMDVRRWESWYRGHPELRFRCFSPSSQSNFTFVTSIRDTGLFGICPNTNTVDQTWGSINTDLFYWKNQTIGQTVLFHVTEEEGNGDKSVEVNIGGTFKVSSSATMNGSVKFTIKATDKEIGTLMVDQFACPPHYTLGEAPNFSFYEINDGFRFYSAMQ